ITAGHRENEIHSGRERLGHHDLLKPWAIDSAGAHQRPAHGPGVFDRSRFSPSAVWGERRPAGLLPKPTWLDYSAREPAVADPFQPLTLSAAARHKRIGFIVRRV